MGSTKTAGSRASSGLGTSLVQSAQTEFNKGPQTYTNPLYAGMSGTTNQGIDQTVAAANAAAPSIKAAADWNNNLLQTGGNPSLTEQQLLSVAKGEQFGQEAPGYARLRAKALDDATTGVASSFLTNGRFGSSVMGAAAGEAATDVIAGMDYGNYQNDIARQERALASIEGQRQQGLTNQMGAAAAVPAYAQAMLMPGQVITQAGQIKDADAQAKLMADYDLWERNANDRTDQIAQFMSLLQGSQGMPGTQEKTPWWQQALGVGSTIAGIL